MVCLSGLLYQSSFILSEYFKYEVISSTTLSQTDDYILRSISTCFEDQEVFNYKMFNSKYKSSLTFNDTDAETSYESGLELHRVVTTADILDFSPPADSFIDSCEIRNSSTYRYHYYEKDGCYQHFHVEKFTIAAMVCYKSTLNGGPHVYNRETAYFTPSDQGELLYIHLNGSLFDHFDIITNVMHPPHMYPWYDIPLAQERVRGYDSKTKRAVNNLFGSKSSSINVVRKAPPYQTNCHNYADYGYKDSKDCLRSCLHHRIERTFNKASVVNHHFNGSSKKMMTNEDFMDSNFDAKYKIIIKECENMCPANDCVFESTFTRTSGIDYSQPGIYVTLSDRPSFDIRYNEKVLFCDTISFIFSALGFWFGFSIYGLNPFIRKVKVKCKCSHNNCDKSRGWSLSTINSDSEKIYKLEVEIERLKERVFSNQINF